MSAFGAPRVRSHRSLNLPRVLLFSLAIGSLATAAYALGWDAENASSPFRASTFIVLVASGLWLLFLTAGSLRIESRSHRAALSGRRLWNRGLFVGAVWSYLVALTVGPQPGVRYVFLAALVLWVCLLAWLWNISYRAPDVAAKIWQRRWIRLPVAAVFWALTLLFGGEATLRFVDIWAGPWGESNLGSTVSLDHRQPAKELTGHVEPTSLTASAATTEAFHIALVGRRIPQAKGAWADCLSRLEALESGIELQYLDGSPAELANCHSAVSRELKAYQPSLVLLVLAVDDDLICKEQTLSPFDWQSLSLVQAVRSHLAVVNSAVTEPALTTAHDSSEPQPLSERCESRLSICHVPLEAEILQRWDDTLTQLDRVWRRCESASFSVAIVLVPAEFQVDSTTLDCLCRRAGYAAAAIDLDLPQRRMTTFAASHQLPLIDLLPYLRASKKSPYCRHSCQWNETGSAIVGEAIAQFVRGRYGSTIAATQSH